MTRRPSSAFPGREIYLDNNATTKPLPSVITAMAHAMADGYGNASSVHAAGERARRLLRLAREQVAKTLSASASEVVFTSGATEANNLALLGCFEGNDALHRLITTHVEHSSVLAAAEHLSRRGVEITLLPVDTNGLIDPEAMVRAIKPGCTLVSIQWASNETGVLQPIPMLAAAARNAGAVFHTDAVQAVGKVPVDVGKSSVDLMSLSAHKLHGPLGVGALVGPGVHRLAPRLLGGAQEGGQRAGTENIPAIVGLATALEVRREHFDAITAMTRGLRDDFEARLVARGLVASINGGAVERLPNTCNVRLADVDGEALMIRLDQLGIRCSQSSACTNHRPEPSYVLRAMGLTEAEAYSSVRFGFSELNTPEEVEIAFDAISEVHASLVAFALA